MKKMSENNSLKKKEKKVFLCISANCYIYTNYICLESTYNTDSYTKFSAGGNNFEKKS